MSNDGGKEQRAAWVVPLLIALIAAAATVVAAKVSTDGGSSGSSPDFTGRRIEIRRFVIERTRNGRTRLVIRGTSTAEAGEAELFVAARPPSSSASGVSSVSRWIVASVDVLDDSGRWVARIPLPSRLVGRLSLVAFVAPTCPPPIACEIPPAAYESYITDVLRHGPQSRYVSSRSREVVVSADADAW